MEIRGITVGNLIGETSKVRLYLGEIPNKETTNKTATSKEVLIKVAKTFDDNGVLADEAGKFTALKAFEDEVSALQQQQSGQNAHYDWLYARIENSFLEPTQGDRRINVYSMPDTQLNKLVPLPKLYAGAQIDARTSAWILGRLFKFFSFFELLAASGENPIVDYPCFSAGDFFIGPERHRVIYCNYSGEQRDVAAFDRVKKVTKYIRDWVVIDEDVLEDVKYSKLLTDLSELGRPTFEEAHRYFYEVIEQLWGIQYYPFTYRDRNESTWKTIKEG